ncbi:MAG: AbrB/MazE/SpoVT family DNA-binding domain-containing protein [Candidatus Korarchaeota archaeon]|nr:AbrB/MazE/SpoVT family DNA-binding domain-containing protein [Candidatus Korarchaeota archaeon]
MEAVVDSKGRIVLPKNVRKKLGLKEGDKVVITLEKDGILIKKLEDPEKVLEELLGDLTFSRELRRVAERQALKEVSV